MNFKRLRGIATVAFTTIAAALLAGCMNSMAGSVDSSSRMATLQLSATGIPNDYDIAFENSYPTARSITPDNPYKPNDTTLTFYLSGKSTTGKTLADTKVELVEKTPGTGVYGFVGKVTLPSMIWDLELTAYTDYPSKPVLHGYSWVDLRNGSGTTSFTLSPENLRTPGSVKITGGFYSNDNVDSYTIGIYKKDSPGESVDVVEVTTVTPDASGIVDFDYDKSSIDPKNYFFRIITKKGAMITGSFIDTLIVDAGNALVRDLGTLDFVNKKPGEPTDFTASLKDGFESTDGTYLVKLGWASGGGETNFEVELTEYAADGTGTDTGTKKIYGMPALASADEEIIYFRSSDIWTGEGGAMTYGDTETYFKLKLGVVYEVRIRARNSFGVSNWVEREPLLTAPAGFTPYGAEKINRMKIEYDLNGGTLEIYNATSNNHKLIPELYTEYKTWKGTDLDLLVIDNGTTAANHLKKGSTPFDTWVDSSENEVLAADYKNLSVKASFDPSLEASIEMKPEPQDVLRSDITVTYGKSNALTANSVNVSTPGTYEVPKKIDGDDMFLRIVLDASTTEYKNIKFKLMYIEQSEITMSLTYEDTNNNSCVIPLDSYTGIIKVLVMADTTTNVSQTLIFNLK